MRLLNRVLLVMLFSGHLLGVFAQDRTTHNGFAVITLVSGTPAGLVSTETIENLSGAEVEHAVLAPVPLTTNASILVRVGAIGDNSTAIAVANPSTGSGGVNLVLTDMQGSVVLNTTFTLGPGGQLARFLNEFFPTTPTGFTTPLLLTVSSEIPVAILAFNFRASDFTAVPLTSLATPTPVAVQPLTSQAVGTQPLAQPVARPAPTVTFPGSGLGMPSMATLPMMVTPPATITGIGTPTMTGTVTMQPMMVTPPVTIAGIGTPTMTGTMTMQPMMVTPPVTITGIGTPTMTGTATMGMALLPTTATTTVPTIGGPGALVFPQVVTGGGWSTEIAVGNTSAGTQVIRIDFFSPTGVLVQSVTGITIAPRGVFFVTANLSI